MQLATADLSLGNIVVLEAETGSGKTEAALWRFVQLFQNGEVDSLFFALPTRVAASKTRRDVSSRTFSRPFSTRSTVATLTPASRATSVTVGRLAMIIPKK